MREAERGYVAHAADFRDPDIFGEIVEDAEPVSQFGKASGDSRKLKCLDFGIVDRPKPFRTNVHHIRWIVQYCLKI